MEKIAPVFGGAFNGEDRAGRHIVNAHLREGIDEGGNSRIMRKQRDGIIAIVQTGHHLSESLRRSMVQFGNNPDFFVTKGMFEGFGRLERTFGGAGQESVDSNTGPDETLGHGGCVPFASVIQRPMDVSCIGIVPAAFGMAYYQ